MPTIQLQAEVSREALLDAVEQLSPPELDQFVAEVLKLRTRRGAARLGAVESELIVHINQGLPEAMRERYKELIDRRRDESLTPEEHEQLLRLTAEEERIEGDRLSALAELARIRGIPLRTLMDDLGSRRHPMPEPLRQRHRFINLPVPLQPIHIAAKRALRPRAVTVWSRPRSRARSDHPGG